MAVLTTASPRSESWEQWLGLGCVALGLTGLIIVHYPAFWARAFPAQPGLAAIGTVVPKAGWVRYRPSGSPFWHDLPGAEQEVSSDDMVFTHSDGTAEVRLADGPKIELLPSTLVVVRATGQVESVDRGWLAKSIRMLTGSRPRATLDLKQGAIKLYVRRNSRPARLQAGKKSFDIEAFASDAILDVVVNTNDAAKPVTFSASGAAPVRVSESGGVSFVVEGAPAAVMSPRMGETIVAKDRKVPFAWQAAYQGPATVRIEGKKIKPISIRAKGLTALAELSAGEYRWKLELGKSGETPWIPFRVADLVPPAIISPLDEAVFHATREHPEPVYFSWETVEDGLFPEVEITDVDHPTPKILVSGAREGASVKLHPGSFEWRARSLDAAGNPSLWTEFRRLSVQDPSTAGAEAPASPVLVAEKKDPVQIKILPTLEVPKARATTQLGQDLKLHELTILLRWLPYRNAREYELKIFDEKKALVKHETVHEPQYEFVLKSLDHTRYAYQVITHAGAQRIASDLVPIKIEFSSPIPRHPEYGTAEKRNHWIVLTWQRTTLTQEYRVQIALEPGFRQVVFEKRGPLNSASFRPKKTGTYYWRVKSVVSGKESAWSPQSRFLVK